jgi:uncharacterized protein YigE (DUF2233 family)
MKRLCSAARLLLPVFLLAGAPSFGAENGPLPLVWQLLAPGLELAVPETPGGREPELQAHILRINPELFDFTLHSIRWEGGPPRTAATWARSEGLVAVINAGMYLPDGKTATGYMRRGDDHNNRLLTRQYGAFFVAGPRQAGLPRAAVLDRAADDWEKLLPDYEIVVQNLRLMGRGGVQIWPERASAHAVAAVGQDRSGRILFIHCRTPVTVHNLVKALLAQADLELATAMYAEGGSEAAMAVNLPFFRRVWTGHSRVLPALAMLEAPLPNVLGVRPKERLILPP